MAARARGCAAAEGAEGRRAPGVRLSRRLTRGRVRPLISQAFQLIAQTALQQEQPQDEYLPGTIDLGEQQPAKKSGCC